MGAPAWARCRFRLQYNAAKKTSVVRGSIMRSIAVLLASALSFIAGGLSSGEANAHHSFATHYILDQPIELTGTVTEVTLRNPHSFIMMDVTDEQGVTEEWEVEIHSVPLMRRFGVMNDTIQPGDTLKIVGPSPRRDKNVTFGNQITLPDGTEIVLLDEIGSRLTGSLTERYGVVETAPTGSLLGRLAGRWGRSNDFDNPDETPMLLTEAGWTARANYDARDTPAKDCIPPNVPSIHYAPYLLEFQIGGERPVIHNEYYDVSRAINLQGTADGPEGFGTRTARIEGETLIVESSGFEEHRAGLATDFDYNGQDRNIPGSDQKRLVESYTLRDNDQELVLNYIVEDSVYLAEPYSHEIQWRRLSQEVELFTMGCDLAIAARSTLNAAAPEDLP